MSERETKLMETSKELNWLERLLRSRDWESTGIIFSATLVSITRWMGANMAGEGFVILDEWMSWWVPVSALLSAAMAVVEAWAFGYIGSVYRLERNKKIKRTITVLTASALLFFGGALVPYVMSQVEGVGLWDVLASRWGSALWSISLTFSTISIVVATGYCSGRRKE